MTAYSYDDLTGLLINNMKKVFCPEEWIKLDLAFSKIELFAILLVDRYGEIIMSQLADYTDIPMSTATGIIDRLVKNGYLKRERSDADRRIVTLQLTVKGKEYAERFKAILSGYIERIFSALDEDEKALLHKVFLKAFEVLAQEKAKEEAACGGNQQVKKIEIE